MVRPGDTITLKDRIHTLARDNMESLVGHIVPGWLDVNPSELSAKVVSLPVIDEVPFEVNMNLIVEFYR